MIQILALREVGTAGKKAEVWFEKGIRAASVEEVFSNYAQIVQKIPPSERWNVYYTVADCFEERGRRLEVQHHLPFDVDGIAPGQSDEQLEMLARLVCDTIGVPYEKCGVLFSGNGLQIIVGTTSPITEIDEFDLQRKYYKAILSRVDMALARAKIQGKSDPSVWSPARLMRFPNTENRKPGKDPIHGRLLNANIERLDVTLRSLARLPEVDPLDQIAMVIADQLPAPDSKTIMDPELGCRFLYWCQTEANKVSEPEWYAMMSITARFVDGRKITHQLSKGHPGYSFDETNIKIDQALEAAGPRTCKNINAISSGKCAGCKHFGSKLVSPILIEGPDHVKTERTGFRHVVTDDKTGKITRKNVDHIGLSKFLARERPYVTLTGAATVWEYENTFFKELSRHELEIYCQNKVDPPPTDRDRKEFVSTVKVRNAVPSDFFTWKVAGLMNFSNGVYDVRTGGLEPHSMRYGFRSSLPCAYDPEAKCPTFEKFIMDVTVGREDLVLILQEFLGYIFASDTCRYEKALVLVGEGSNGKTTLMHVVRALATRHGVSSLSVKAMQDPQNRYMMEGKLINIADENSESSFRDTELLKNFVSGGFVSVKRVYEQPYDYENTTKLIMLCNRLPRISDTTHGLLRKLLIVPFDATFDGDAKDVYLKEKLLAELPGIFNWVIEGYRRLERNKGFTASAVVEDKIRDYLISDDTVINFVQNECLISIDDNEGAKRSDLYDAYRSWCEAQGVPNESSMTFFKRTEVYMRKKLGLSVVEDIFYRKNDADGGKPRKVKFIRTLWKSSF